MFRFGTLVFVRSFTKLRIRVIIFQYTQCMGVLMVSLIAGIIFIAFTFFALLPSFPLNWGADVLVFLKGCLPVLSALVGLICLFIGVADIKDKKEAAREEREAREREEKK